MTIANHFNYNAEEKFWKQPVHNWALSAIFGLDQF